jgi:hypothetical protein
MQGMTNIPREQWGRFLAEFSVEHAGQDADVEAIIGEQSRPIAIRLPLIRVSAAGPGGEPQVQISTGDMTGSVNQAVVDPVRIQVRHWDDGHSAELEMESSAGTAVRVRVTGPPSPVQ